MGINTFLNYRLFCPLCSCELESSLRYTDSKNIISYGLDGDYIIWIDQIHNFSMSNKGKVYYIRYYLHRENNSFGIEFLNNNDKPLNLIPIDIIKKYGEYLQKNNFFKPIQLVRSCLFCRRYQYTSYSFYFKFNEAVFEDAEEIKDELFCLDRLTNQGTKIYILIVSEKETDIYADCKEQTFLDLSCFNDPLWRSRLTLHLSLPEKLEIQNTEKMMDKLDQLLFYS